MIPRRLRAWFRLFPSLFFSNIDFKVRVLFCLLVGVIFQWLGQKSDFDARFRLRGSLPPPKDIVLIELTRSDLLWISGQNPNTTSIRSLKEIVDTSDSPFWNPSIWQKGLENLLALKPKVTIVTFFWDAKTTDRTLKPEQKVFFESAPIFWASKSEISGSTVTPSAFSSPSLSNTGLLEIRPDLDNQIRRYWLTSKTFPHLMEQIFHYPIDEYLGQLIHFQGPAGSFKSFSFEQLIQNKIPPEAIQDAYVVLGVKDYNPSLIQTPVGSMSIAELQANLINNFAHNRWVSDIPLSGGLFILVAVLFLCLWVLRSYPQNVAFVFMLFLALFIVSLSAGLFDLFSIRLIAEGPLAIIIVSYVVISSYKLAESEKHHWQFEKEMQNLAELEGLKNNFLSLISHDLKNPIAKIQGITDRLLASRPQGLSKEVQSDLVNIQKIAEELRKYITSLLNLTRVEARNIKLTKEVCDINSVIEETIKRVEPLASQKQIRIETELEPLFSMEIDPTLISEVLINLLENAIKYSPNNTKVVLRSSEVGNEVRIEVKDQGPGIPEADLPKVFDRFYRGSLNGNTKVSGPGLGLYLVKYFIELHKGKVFIHSTRGEGTSIGFSLPLEEPEENYADLTSSYS